jgi:hypothetical protein
VTSVELLSKLDLNILLSNSYFESGIYNHIILSSIYARGANTDLILPTRDTPIFGTISADDAPKSR